MKKIQVRMALLAVILISSFSLMAHAKVENGFTTMLAIDTPPVAVPDVITTAQKTPAIIAVTANDQAGSAAIDPQSVRLIQPFTGAPVLSFTYLNEGTYTVNQTDGTITFTPVDAFGGVPAQINYTVRDINGLESNQAKITVTVTPTPPTAVPDFATTTEGKPVSMTVWKNDISGSKMFDPQMVKLIDPVSGLRVFFVTIPNEGLFAVNYFTGEVTFTPCDGPPDAGFVGVSTINYDIQDLNGEFSNQAAITVTVKAAALPVTLTVFTVTREGEIARLNWETTEETNSDHFEIQHSISGKDWNKIGNVKSHGDSKVTNTYTFTDSNPASGGPSHGGPSHGENLYRLKMIDKDATFAYSRIQSVRFEGLGADLSIYPNPVADKMIIRDFAQVTNLVISDLNGRTVLQAGATATGEINVKNLNAGMYVVKITRANGIASAQKIVISK